MVSYCSQALPLLAGYNVALLTEPCRPNVVNILNGFSLVFLVIVVYLCFINEPTVHKRGQVRNLTLRPGHLTLEAAAILDFLTFKSCTNRSDVPENPALEPNITHSMLYTAKVMLV